MPHVKNVPICAVCGEPTNGKENQPILCGACLVFFRRSVKCKKEYMCRGSNDCVISSALRKGCRSCRMEMCLKQGLRPENFRSRDLIGPRVPYQKSPKMASETENEVNELFTQASNISDFLLLQKRQNAIHKNNRVIPGVETCGKTVRQTATPGDINFSLAVSFRNAHQWAMQFAAFRKLCKSEKDLVLSEYAIAYMLVDQGFKTSQESEDGDVWILQNDTVPRMQEDSSFLRVLSDTIAKPFSHLQMDRTECVLLKTLLLSTPSFPGFWLFKNIADIKKKAMSQLMAYSSRRFFSDGAVRFGEVMLLMSSIRCAVKEFYNQTRKQGIFNLKNVEPLIRRRMLS